MRQCRVADDIGVHPVPADVVRAIVLQQLGEGLLRVAEQRAVLLGGLAHDLAVAAQIADDVIEEMKATFPTYPVRPLKDFMSLMTSTNIPALQAFINSMIALAVSIGLLVIFLTMYTTVLERTRDIGVLKSLGASRLLIVRSLLTETTLLCLFGIAAGVGLSYLVRATFLGLFPTLSILITPEWLIRAAFIALMGAVFGASYPAWLASRKDPVDALTYD